MWPSELDALPVPRGARWPMVDRRTVVHVAEPAAAAWRGAEQTLVAASVWGSGTGGYARHRTLRVFDHDGAEVGDRLAVAAQLLRAGGR
jgi:Putative 8-oxoguanine DNA glycosylase OGG-like protein